MRFGRRRVVRSIASGLVVGIAGCSRRGSGTPGTGTYVPPDVVVFNDTDVEQRAAITVTTGSADEPVVSETTTIAPGEAAEYRDPIPPTTTATLRVDVERGPSEHREFSVETERESIQAVIEGEAIAFRTR